MYIIYVRKYVHIYVPMYSYIHIQIIHTYTYIHICVCRDSLSAGFWRLWILSKHCLGLQSLQLSKVSCIVVLAGPVFCQWPKQAQSCYFSAGTQTFSPGIPPLMTAIKMKKMIMMTTVTVTVTVTMTMMMMMMMMMIVVSEIVVIIKILIVMTQVALVLGVSTATIGRTMMALSSWIGSGLGSWSQSLRPSESPGT